MQKTIRFDLEHNPRNHVMPLSARHDADVVVVFRRSPLYGERPEGIPSRQKRGKMRELFAVQLTFDAPFVSSTKRGPRSVICAYVVAVTARERAPAGMKFRMHPECSRDPDIFGQYRVQSAPQLNGAPFCGDRCSRRLAAGMYPRVGTTCAHDCDRCITEAPLRVFEHALHSTLAGLPLPSCESGSVVVQYELNRRLRHAEEARRRGVPVQPGRSREKRVCD
jgi:hypothetical protein